MTSHQPRPALGVDRAQTQTSPGPPHDLKQDVDRLGQELLARVEEVLDLTVARTGGLTMETALQSSAVRISRISTVALARWLAGEDAGVAREASSETWRFYGELAARRTASLNDVITHCLCWSDAVTDVLQQSAAELDVSPQALSQALHMLRIGLELGFIQMSKAFDNAREDADEVAATNAPSV
jgi:hypothetical protein